jgi:hypothetical protein
MTKLKKSSNKRPNYVCKPSFAIRKARRGIKLNKWELEKIANDSASAVRYSMEVLKGRFIDAEENIRNNAMCASQYAIHILNSRWEAAEPVISTCSNSSIEYAVMLGERFISGEPAILKRPDVDRAIHYAIKVIKGRWPELERKLLKHKTSSWLRPSFYNQVDIYLNKIIGGRWLEWEEKLLRENRMIPIYNYAKFLGGKLPDALHQKMLLQSFDNKRSKFAKKYLRLLERTEGRFVRFFNSLSSEEREELLNKIKS